MEMLSDIPSLACVTLKLVDKKDQSLDLEWEPLEVASNLQEFYHYLLQYRQVGDSDWTNWTEPVSATSQTDLSLRVDGLDVNTQYEIQVVPLRRMKDVTTGGSASEILVVSTLCGGELVLYYGWYLHCSVFLM